MKVKINLYFQKRKLLNKLIMDERKAGRILGTIIADLIYFSIIGVLSVSLVSKLIRIAIILANKLLKVLIKIMITPILILNNF